MNGILDADMAGFFDRLSQVCLMDFLKLRIADRRLLRLIGKWLKAGILEEGLITVPEQGTPPWHEGGLGDFTAALESLPALCPGPVGRGVAQSPRPWRCHHRTAHADDFAAGVQ